nr:hypothetical protein [Tanacetum cinerariifolium]
MNGCRIVLIFVINRAVNELNVLPPPPLATITGCCLPPSLLNTTTPVASKILFGGTVFQFQQEGIANLRLKCLSEKSSLETMFVNLLDNYQFCGEENETKKRCDKRGASKSNLGKLEGAVLVNDESMKLVKQHFQVDPMTEDAQESKQYIPKPKAQNTTQKVNPTKVEKNSAGTKKKPTSIIPKSPKTSVIRLPKPKATPTPVPSVKSSSKKTISLTTTLSKKKIHSVSESRQIAPISTSDVTSIGPKQLPKKRSEAKASTSMASQKENERSLKGVRVDGRRLKVIPTSIVLRSNERAKNEKSILSVETKRKVTICGNIEIINEVEKALRCLAVQLKLINVTKRYKQLRIDNAYKKTKRRKFKYSFLKKLDGMLMEVLVVSKHRIAISESAAKTTSRLIRKIDILEHDKEFLFHVAFPVVKKD